MGDLTLFPLPEVLPAGARQLDLTRVAQLCEEGHGRARVGRLQFGLPILQAINATQFGVPGGLVVPSTHNNSAPYNIALSMLGSSVLLSSTVKSASRTESGVKLAVTTPGGAKVINAKQAFRFPYG